MIVIDYKFRPAEELCPRRQLAVLAPCPSGGCGDFTQLWHQQREDFIRLFILDLPQYESIHRLVHPSPPNQKGKKLPPPPSPADMPGAVPWRKITPNRPLFSRPYRSPSFPSSVHGGVESISGKFFYFLSSRFVHSATSSSSALSRCPMDWERDSRTFCALLASSMAWRTAMSSSPRLLVYWLFTWVAHF